MPNSFDKKKKEAYKLYTANCNTICSGFNNLALKDNTNTHNNNIHNNSTLKNNTGNKRKTGTTSPDRIPETSKLQTDAILDTKQKITKLDPAPVHTQIGRQEQKLHALKRKHSLEHAKGSESYSQSESDSSDSYEFTEEQVEQLNQIQAEFEIEQAIRLVNDLLLYQSEMDEFFSYHQETSLHYPLEG